MIPAAQLTVEDLKKRLEEVAEFLKEPGFKDKPERYLLLRRWLVDFGKDTRHTEEHRTDAYLASQALKWAFNSESGKGLRRLAKAYEYKQPELVIPPTRHYFAQNLLTSACRVN